MPDDFLARALLRLIGAYQYLLSPWIGNSCRYWPTCSQYAREAIELHGAGRGSYLALRRIGRCHPYGRGGVDPVPAAFGSRCDCRGSDMRAMAPDATAAARLARAAGDQAPPPSARRGAH